MSGLQPLCGDVRCRRDGDKLAQDVLGRLQVVLGDHQRFLDVLDGVALRHQAFDLAVQGQAARSGGRRWWQERGRGGGGRGHGCRE